MCLIKSLARVYWGVEYGRWFRRARSRAWAAVQNLRCIASLWTKGLCRVDSDSDETVMSGNVVGRLCRAAHYSTWQKAFQFGTHRVSKRSLIIIMPTVLLMLLLLRWPWLTSVLKGVGRALLAGLSLPPSFPPPLPPSSSLSHSLSLLLSFSLALSARSFPPSLPLARLSAREPALISD